MIKKKNKSAILISILTINFPTQYPKKNHIDELDSILPAIAFPSFTTSEINMITSNAESMTEFRDILKGVKFYFPLVPVILHLIADYDDLSEDIVNFCACIVLCSYVSWKLFAEYTKNFEHLPLLLDAIPFVSQSTEHAPIITQVYYNCICYYLEEGPSFNFKSIYKSMSLLFEHKVRYVLSTMQSLFLPILLNFISQYDDDLNEDCEIFIRFLGQLTDLYPDIIGNENAKEIVERLSYHIGKIQLNPLHLFANLSHQIPKENAVTICSTHPMAFYKYLTENIQTFQIPDLSLQNNIFKSQITFPDLIQCIEGTMHCIIDTTFKHDFPKKPILSFERRYPNGYFFTEDIRDKLSYIAIGAQSNEESINTLLKCFHSYCVTQKDDKLHNFLFYAFTVIVSHMKLSGLQSANYWETVFSSDVFNPEFSSFDCEDEKEIINQIRAEAVDAMVKSGYLELQVVFTQTVENTVMFAEIIHRLYPHISKISKTVLLSYSFISKLCAASVTFQKLNQEETNPDFLQIIESTRVCLFHVISHALMIKEVADTWFSLPLFNTFFVSFIFEEKMRPFILEQYRLYFSKYFQQPNAAFMAGLRNIIDILNVSIPEDKFFLISIDFIKMINTVFSLKADNINLIDELIKIIIQSINNLTNSEASHLYFIEVLNLLTFIKLDENLFALIRNTLKKLNNPEYTHQIKSGLFKLSSGIPNPSKKFSLQQPEIIKIILENCEGDDDIANILDEIVYPLIQNSIYNCIQAYQSGIDVFLFDILLKMRGERLEKIGIVKRILDVLTEIHSIKASFYTALKIFELFGPIDIRHISVFIPLIIQKLISIFKKMGKSPSSYLPISSKLEISGLNSSIFEKSFELSFWYNDEPFTSKQELTQICNIYDSKNKGINVLFTPKSIILKSNRRHESCLEFNVTFPSGKWHLVSLKFVFVDRITNVAAYVDGSETESQQFHFRKFTESNVSMTIGTNEDSIPTGYIACCAVFPYNQSAFHVWSNHQLASSDEPLFIVDFSMKNGAPKPRCINEARINTHLEEIPESLINIFVKNAKAHSLLLLFAEFDFLTVEGTKAPSIPDLTVELIISFLQYSKSAQLSFHESRCADVIAHLLSTCDPTNLNYSIYLHMSAMLTAILIPDLKKSFLTKIVLNMDIWGRADSEILFLVTQHWAQNLFIEYKEEMKSVTSISHLLLSIKEYFQNEKIVQNLTNLISKIADYYFAAHDFMMIIGVCITNTNFKLINIYLDILKRILASRNDSDQFIVGKANYVSLLHNMLGFNDQNIFISIIDIVIICHRKNLIQSLTLMQHLNIIMGQISARLSTFSCLHVLLVKANSETPELYPICCVIALNCGKDAILSLCQAIVPSTYFGNSPECLMWLIAVFCNAEVESRQKLFRILFNDSYAKIEETCTLMEIICIASNQSPDHYLMPFLSLGFSLISDHPERFHVEFAHKMLKIAYNSLLFRSKPTIRNWIQKLISISPFGDVEISEEKKDLSIFSRPKLLYRKINEFIENGLEFGFCPRLDESGTWLDTSLALQCLNLFEIYFSQSLLNYDVMLCAFMLKVRPNAARIHLQRINITKYLHSIPANIISFVISCGEKADLSFMPKQSFSRLNAFSALEEFSGQNEFGADLVKMATNIISFFEKSSKIEREFTSLINHGVSEQCLISIEELVNTRQKQRYEYLEIWRQMWHEMTRERGIWNCAKTAASVKNHWKRSSKLCNGENNCLAAGYPHKMVLNNDSYSDHIEASFSRDSGSAQEAKSKVDEFRNRGKTRGIIFSTLRPDKNFIKPKPIHQLPRNAVVFKHKATLVKPKGCVECDFEVQYDNISINKKTVLFSEIKEVCYRWRLHRPTAFEVFKKNGKGYLINIPDMNNQSTVKYLSLFVSNETLQSITNKWVNCEISTFDYLMKLNSISGRTFNDISQYPVMPWIVADNSSENIDFNDPAIFRDLSKPMGALNPERLNKLRKNSTNTGEVIPVHLYQNGYLSPIIILSYLARIEPFTSLHIQYHSGAFEHVTKIFKSIPIAYKNATNLMTDFRELVPEFFSSPDFLLNSEAFDLGMKKSGNVTLPKWAKSSTHFIYMNRRALESSYVSQNINKWIDLIWGYKQVGDEAVKANNTYYPFMYSSVWENNSLNLSPQQIETILSEVGQIPIQLFTSPHPTRSKPRYQNVMTSTITYKTIDAQIALSSFSGDPAKGLAITTSGKLIHMVFRGTFVTNISIDPVDMSYFGSFDIGGLGLAGFGDILDPTRFICANGVGKSFIVYKPIEKISYNSGQLAYPISHASHDGDIIVTTSATYIAVWNIRDLMMPMFTLATYRESIVCVQISVAFDLIVTGTRDGFLQFSSIDKKKSLKLVDLSGLVPMIVKICPAWGFVLVYAVALVPNGKRFFMLFTANGMKFKQIEIFESITAIDVYKSFDGFDFAVLGTEKCNIYHFEVFFLSMEKPFFKAAFPIMSISFIREQNAFYCSGKNNKIIAIPAPLL